MDFSRVIILLARQRCGTHALRSVLASHPDIEGVEEIFHLKSASQPGTGDTNFFVFLKQQLRREPLRLLPVDYEDLFLEYLDFLGRRTPKRYLVLDVKCNTVHHITRSFQPLVGFPYLFELMLKHQLKAFFLTRRNYLRTFLSLEKARLSRTFHVHASGPEVPDAKITLDVGALRYEMERWEAEDELVRRTFSWPPVYRERWRPDYFFTSDYTDVFPTTDGTVSSAFCERFSNWLGVPNEFAQKAAYQKLACLPLSQSLENFDEVYAMLRGTRFAYCLTDEPGFNDSSETKRGLLPRWRWAKRLSFAKDAPSVPR